MIRAFVLAAVRVLKNRVLHQVRRMRQPRYLISALIGVAYFGFLFWNQLRRDRAGMAPDVISLMLLAGIVLAWIVPALSSLEFTEAETHFLFTAPLSRWRILLYKLIRSQPGMLIGVFVGVMVGIPATGVFGIWAVYTAVMVYMMFVALAREHLRERGVPVVVPALIALLTAIWMIWFIIHHPALSGPREARTFSDPALQPLLLVPRFLAATLYARDAASILGHIVVVLMASAGLFVVAARLRVNFNDLVITASQRAARWKGSFARPESRVGFRRVGPLFRLRSGALPEAAIIWKNTIAVVRIAGPTILLILGFFAFFVVMGRVSEIWLAAALPMCATATCLFPLVGAMMIRQDFRMDVMRLDVIKTYPLAGMRLVAAEIAAPAAFASLIQLLLLAGLGILLANQTSFPTPPFWPQALLIAFLFTIPVHTIQFVIGNAVPLVYPGWLAGSKDDQRGVAVLGQRVLTMLANVLLLAVALAPAAVVAGAGFLVAHRLARDSQLILAMSTIPAIALLFAEAWGALRLLGAQYDRMDLARDLDPGMI
jgi:ABC-2 type transport system permease protein